MIRRKKEKLIMCVIELLDRLVDIIDFHPWIANLFGIFTSAGVAIWVMNKNHIEAANRDKQKYLLEDKVELNKINMRLIDIISEASTLLGTIKIDKSDLMNEYCIDIFKDYYELLLEHRLELIKFTQTINSDKYDEVIKVIRILLYDIKLTKVNIIKGDDLGYKKEKILELLDQTHRNIYDYLEKNYHDKDFINKFIK
ncbi:hypothetical protein [Macrococcus animalis]|uniref:hypothetical protein n=1 Tax=Macrococcus animalis TaxID=3395467 RepID=UPI0039BE149C